MRWRDKACRAMRAGATTPMTWARASPFSLTPFLPSLLPTVAGRRVAGAPPPPDPLQIRRFGEGEVGGGIVPQPSLKVLPRFFHRLTMRISRYECFMVIRVWFLSQGKVF